MEKLLVIIMGCIVVSLLFGIMCTLLAQKKKRNAVGWLFLGMIGLFISLIVLANLKAKEKKVEQKYRYPYTTHELMQLSYLKNIGALTAEEFEREKKLLLK